MAYVTPTKTDFTLRFPVFASVSDDLLQSALNEAADRVDETWREEDFKMARMLYAAHLLALDGHGAQTDGEVAGLSSLGVSSFSSGTLSVSFGKGASAASLDSTRYGKRFRELLRANFAGVLVVAAP